MLYSYLAVWQLPAARLPQHSQHPGRVAQLVEHSTLNRLVVGSIPTASTNQSNYPLDGYVLRMDLAYVQHSQIHSKVPKLQSCMRGTMQTFVTNL